MGWRRWVFYLIARLIMVALTVIVLEVASTTNRYFVFLAILPALGALLIPYRVPRRRRRRPATGVRLVAVVVAAAAVAAWPWYFIASATAPVTPVAATSRHFHLEQNFTYSATNGCLVLIDDDRNYWLTGTSLYGSIQSGEVTLYRTSFGWTTESHPTESPSAFFRTPHLNQRAIPLTPATRAACQSDDIYAP